MSVDARHLTLHEAADALGVHYMTAYRYVRLGLLPARKQGATWQLEWKDVDAMRRGVVDVGDGRRHPAPWATRLEARLVAGDEVGARGVVDAAMAAGADGTSMLLDVLAPAMRAIGQSWAAGTLDVGEEHRASVIAMRLTGRLGSHFARRGRSKGTVVVGAVEGERHSLPVTMLADVVRGAGWAVVDLGADLPAASFRRLVADQDGLAAVCVSVSWDGNLPAVAPTVAALREVTSAPVLVGGGAVAGEEAATALGGDGWALDGRGVVALLQSLVLT